MSTIRPLSISKVVYQDTEASDCLSNIYGDSFTNLLRRHPHHGRFSRASCRAHRNSDKGLGVSRLRDKEEEVNLEANPDYPVSRFHCKFNKDAPSTARRKTVKIKVICSIYFRKCAHSQRSFKFLGSVPGSSASFADGSPPLQGYSERLDSGNFSSRRQGKLQENYKFIRRCNQGSTLVDSRPCTSKRQDDYSSKSRFSNFLRCFKDRMGSSSTRNQHRRSLERARSLRPHKLLGARSSISGYESFSATDKGESCPVWPGQLHCSSIHQPAGKHKISTPHSIGTRHMVLRSKQEHGDISNSCSREMELHSRWKVQNLSRFKEWMLDHNLFKQVTKHLGLPVVGLFASRVNHQMPEFVSWRPEPGAIATDAFNIPWDFPLSYLFLPFCLIPMCLSKVMQGQVDCILVAPVWRSRPWYPVLLSMLIERPLLLPQGQRILTQGQTRFTSFVARRNSS